MQLDAFMSKMLTLEEIFPSFSFLVVCVIISFLLVLVCDGDMIWSLFLFKLLLYPWKKGDGRLSCIAEPHSQSERASELSIYLSYIHPSIHLCILSIYKLPTTIH
ncbi:hypothetical protein Dimus_012107 [Dionaea muscipula]